MTASDILARNEAAWRRGCRIIANKGGTRSTKTWSLLQLMLIIATSTPGVLVSVVSESMPHLKRGALRDFDRILDASGMIEGVHYQRNRSDNFFKFGGSTIEFFSADNYGHVHGAQRDFLFINEANHLPFETCRQLAVRTASTVFLDWNPAAVFWFDERLAGREGVALIHSTYKDNPFLSAEQVAEIESNKDDTRWWRVYGLGETGTIEGLIYDNWDIIPAMPAECRRRVVGIDFGYKDPTAVVEVALMGGELYVQQICYRPGMSNPDIAAELRAAGYSRVSGIVADCAEPKSIAEINALGFSVKPSPKGADSVANGIQVVRRYKMHVTAESVDVIRELRNYAWKTDSSGHALGVPEHAFSHSMDALRYAVSTYFNSKPSARGPRTDWVPLYPSDADNMPFRL